VAKTRSRSPKSRASASRAKGAKKGVKKSAKKSAVKRGKTPTRATLGYVQEPPPEGLDVKKLRLDLQRAIDTLQRRIEQGDPARRLPETRALFLSWVEGIDGTICSDPSPSGPCGEDMFFGS
jgi:hypothetical protein